MNIFPRRPLPLFSLILLAGVLSGCQSAPPALTREALRAQLAILPGAAVVPGDEAVVSYPGEALFAAGAAVPFPGGTRVLDPLAELVAAHPGVRWAGTVRASGGPDAAYDQALAEKRAELLGRYFVRRGIDSGRLRLIAAAGEGAPLQLNAELPAPDPAKGK